MVGIRTMSESTINSNQCGMTCLQEKRATVIMKDRNAARTTEEEHPQARIRWGWVLLYPASVITAEDAQVLRA